MKCEQKLLCFNLTQCTVQISANSANFCFDYFGMSYHFVDAVKYNPIITLYCGAELLSHVPKHSYLPSWYKHIGFHANLEHDPQSKQSNSQEKSA